MKTSKLYSVSFIVGATVCHVQEVASFQLGDIIYRPKVIHRSSCSRSARVSSLHASKTSSSPSQDDKESLSPWSPGKWKITLQFKREQDSSPPDTSIFSYDSTGEYSASISKLLGDDWGANSAQLVLPLEVLVTSDTSKGHSSDPKRESIQSSWLGGKPTGSIECLSNENKEFHSTYINDKGQQYVQISPGPWRIEPPTPLTSPTGKSLSGQASLLRFTLTIQNAIQRNSIYFPMNQLLLLQSNTFREEQYEKGLRTILPFQNAKDNAQKILDEQLDHESGDRRLDGKDLLPLLEGYKDVAGLIWERDEKYKKWKEIEAILPYVDPARDLDTILDDDTSWGVWPGDTDLLTIERGVILAVVEKKGAKLRGDISADTIAVGTWSGLPIWDED